jgi:FAD/FMN-containing dehydrogenase
MTSSAQQAPTIVTPADPGWDDARQAWNLAVDQHPDVVALPESAADVVAAVDFARRHGLRVTVQGTGHNARPRRSLAGTLLINTRGMRQLSVYPTDRIARAQAGVVWQEVADAAAKHGLAGLAGSAPDVGVVGYTLGGGMSWLGRTYGLSANNVAAFEAVTADGRLVRADAVTEPDLFWALRGGGGSFAVVTAVELRLFPVTEVYAGLLFWPADAGSRVLHAWRELTHSPLPDAFTTTARYLNFPPLPEFPQHLAGRSFVAVDAIHLGPPGDADRLLAPLRALTPAIDTVQTVPAAALGHLHMDPAGPVPAVADGFTLADLTPRAVDEIVRVGGPDAASPLQFVELRHLGGEMSRPRPGNGALAAIAAPYLLLAGGTTPDQHTTAAITAQLDIVKSALSPWSAQHSYLNQAKSKVDPGRFWTPPVYDRLRRIKAAVDPTNRIRASHPVPPADQRDLPPTTGDQRRSLLAPELAGALGAPKGSP